MTKIVLTHYNEHFDMLSTSDFFRASRLTGGVGKLNISVENDMFELQKYSNMFLAMKNFHIKYQTVINISNDPVNIVFVGINIGFTSDPILTMFRDELTVAISYSSVFAFEFINRITSIQYNKCSIQDVVAGNCTQLAFCEADTVIIPNATKVGIISSAINRLIIHNPYEVHTAACEIGTLDVRTQSHIYIIDTHSRIDTINISCADYIYIIICIGRDNAITDTFTKIFQNEELINYRLVNKDDRPYNIAPIKNEYYKSGKKISEIFPHKQYLALFLSPPLVKKYFRLEVL